MVHQVRKVHRNRARSKVRRLALLSKVGLVEVIRNKVLRSEVLLRRTSTASRMPVALRSVSPSSGITTTTPKSSIRMVSFESPQTSTPQLTHYQEPTIGTMTTATRKTRILPAIFRAPTSPKRCKADVSHTMATHCSRFTTTRIAKASVTLTVRTGTENTQRAALLNMTTIR